jgi:hypothetical protein
MELTEGNQKNSYKSLNSYKVTISFTSQTFHTKYHLLKESSAPWEKRWGAERQSTDFKGELLTKLTQIFSDYCLLNEPPDSYKRKITLLSGLTLVPWSMLPRCKNKEI